MWRHSGRQSERPRGRRPRSHRVPPYRVLFRRRDVGAKGADTIRDRPRRFPEAQQRTFASADPRLSLIRGAIVTLAIATALLLAACGTTKSHGVVHVRPHVPTGRGTGPCASKDCGPYSAALRWSITWSHTPTGYYIYVNRSEAANVSASQWVLGGMDCGSTYTVGVKAHDKSGHSSAEYATTYKTPACTGPVVKYYVAQTSAGSGNGSSCANAQAVSTLGTSAQWKQGNVIGLCGTITSDITAHGSGRAADPITLYFEPGAKLSQPACLTACLMLSNQRYITVDGGADGIVQNTGNGTDLPNRVASTGIVADPCEGCTIENVTIQNIYVHSSSSDTDGAAGNTAGLDVSGRNLTVAHNTIRNARGGVFVDENGRQTDSNLRFYGNNIFDTDYGFWLAFANNPGGASLGPFYIYDNHIHDHKTWDTTTDTFHHDGVMVYSSGSSPTAVGGGIYVYGNRFDGTSGANATADIFLPGSAEGNAIAESSGVYIFNNVFDHPDNSPGNGTLVLHAGNVRVWNNTLVQPNSASNAGLDLNDGGTIDLRNNLFDGGNVLVRDLDTRAVTLSPGPNYNFFADGGSNAFVCNGYFPFPSGFAQWQKCTRGDSHGTAFRGRFVLNSDGSLPLGSAAAGSGENLYGICTGQPNPGVGALCANINGTVRPSSGAWNVGAY